MILHAVQYTIGATTIATPRTVSTSANTLLMIFLSYEMFKYLCGYLRHLLKLFLRKIFGYMHGRFILHLSVYFSLERGIAAEQLLSDGIGNSGVNIILAILHIGIADLYNGFRAVFPEYYCGQIVDDNSLDLKCAHKTIFAVEF